MITGDIQICHLFDIRYNKLPESTALAIAQELRTRQIVLSDETLNRAWVPIVNYQLHDISYVDSRYYVVIHRDFNALRQFDYEYIDSDANVLLVTVPEKN
jgi:hypothetical protein